MELKPCPFCGGAAEIVVVTRHIESNRAVAKCSLCEASTKTFSENKRELITQAWNRRADNG